MTARAEPGDVFEVSTGDGRVFYIQHVAHDPSQGELVRALSGVYERALDEQQIQSVAGSKSEIFYVYYPIAAALRANIVQKVAHVAPPSPPNVRAPLTHDAEGRPKGWLIRRVGESDGKRVKRLGRRERSLPISWHVNHEQLIEMATLGYRADDDPGDLGYFDRFRAQAGVPAEAQESEEPIRHFLYFSEHADAAAAAEDATSKFDGVVDICETEKDGWLLTLDHGNKGDLGDITNRLAAIASRHRGEYDGHEVRV